MKARAQEGVQPDLSDINPQALIDENTALIKRNENWLEGDKMIRDAELDLAATRMKLSGQVANAEIMAEQRRVADLMEKFAKITSDAQQLADYRKLLEDDVTAHAIEKQQEASKRMIEENQRTADQMAQSMMSMIESISKKGGIEKWAENKGKEIATHFLSQALEQGGGAQNPVLGLLFGGAKQQDSILRGDTQHTAAANIQVQAAQMQLQAAQARMTGTAGMSTAGFQPAVAGASLPAFAGMPTTPAGLASMASGGGSETSGFAATNPLTGAIFGGSDTTGMAGTVSGAALAGPPAMASTQSAATGGLSIPGIGGSAFSGTMGMLGAWKAGQTQGADAGELTGLMSGLSTGSQVGSVFGPGVAAVGAGVGAVSGALVGFFGDLLSDHGRNEAVKYEQSTLFPAMHSLQQSFEKNGDYSAAQAGLFSLQLKAWQDLQDKGSGAQQYYNQIMLHMEMQKADMNRQMAGGRENIHMSKAQFHEGGVIGGPADEGWIFAQRGEAVLHRDATHALTSMLAPRAPTSAAGGGRAIELHMHNHFLDASDADGWLRRGAALQIQSAINDAVGQNSQTALS
jgi:hypothetical protein